MITMLANQCSYQTVKDTKSPLSSKAELDRYFTEIRSLSVLNDTWKSLITPLFELSFDYSFLVRANEKVPFLFSRVSERWDEPIIKDPIIHSKCE